MEARPLGNMEPLSKPLADWLNRLRLCTPADLRRCRGRVRQLARDVPAFDSVWIDALVHARKLTAFQAKLLESGRPEQLAVGPCVLVDQLGHGMSTTYLARHLKGHQRCVLKLIDLPEEQRASALAALEQLVARTENLSHPAVIVPKSCLYYPPHLVTISRYLQGPSLNQLLIRRGRFPAPIVLALARQLVDGLAALEECGILHGELRLQNLRLGSGGYVVMLDTGIGPAIRPELNIRARISPEHYDGIAPERIGTGNPADVRSEFYALGCLLWRLLAGRPPFTTGDPLAKLMAHQTRRVPDVREVAPDTPAEFAEILKVFTDPDPNRRPASFREFRERWGKPKRSHRRRLARFRSLFNTAIPHVPAMRPEESPHRWPMVAAMLFLLSGAALGSDGCRGNVGPPRHPQPFGTVSECPPTNRQVPEVQISSQQNQYDSSRKSAPKNRCPRRHRTHEPRPLFVDRHQNRGTADHPRQSRSASRGLDRKNSGRMFRRGCRAGKSAPPPSGFQRD